MGRQINSITGGGEGVCVCVCGGGGGNDTIRKSRWILEGSGLMLCC